MPPMTECIREISPSCRLEFVCNLFTESYGDWKRVAGALESRREGGPIRSRQVRARLMSVSFVLFLFAKIILDMRHVAGYGLG